VALEHDGAPPAYRQDAAAGAARYVRWCDSALEYERGFVSRLSELQILIESGDGEKK